VYELPPGPDTNVEVDGIVVGPTFRTDGQMVMAETPTEAPAASVTATLAPTQDPAQAAQPAPTEAPVAATAPPAQPPANSNPFIRVVDSRLSMGR